MSCQELLIYLFIFFEKKDGALNFIKKLVNSFLATWFCYGVTK